MKLFYSGLSLSFLLYVILFLSLIFHSSFLFWISVLSSVVFLVAYSLFSNGDKKTLFFIITFCIVIGYVVGLFYQFYYEGILFPIADTNFSIQLVEILSDTGHLIPPQGSFRGVAYSWYSVPFIFGSIFTQVTGLSSYSFAFFVYPLVNYFAILALFYAIVSRLVKENIVRMVAFCIFALNGQLLFFYSTAVFHYEQFAWLFFLITIYAMLMFITEKRVLFGILVPLGAFICAASHHFTSYLLLVFMLSFLLLKPYTVIHKKLFRKKIMLQGNLQRITIMPLLASIIIVATKSYFTFFHEVLPVSQVLQAFIETLIGSRSIGTSKFTPWDYTAAEFNMIVVGNVALLLLTILAFFFSLRQSKLQNRLLEIIALMVGTSLFILFQFSQFRGQELIRFFMPFTFISSLLIGNLYNALNVRRFKKLFSILLIFSVSIFFVAQITFARHHPISHVESEPDVSTLKVKVSIDYILNNGVVNDSVIAYPLGYFESLYAKLYISPELPDEILIVSAIATDGKNLLSSTDYIILYSPLDSQFISKFIKPELREDWSFSVQEIYYASNKIYDNGAVVIFTNSSLK
jgi:hypothetical protein